MTRKRPLDTKPQLLRLLEEVTLFQSVQTRASPSLIQSEICLWLRNTLSTCRQRSSQRGQAACSWMNSVCGEEKGRKEQKVSDLHGLQVMANQQPHRRWGKEQVTHVTWRFPFPCRRGNGTSIQEGDGRRTGWWVNITADIPCKSSFFLLCFQNINRLEWTCCLN